MNLSALLALGRVMEASTWKYFIIAGFVLIATFITLIFYPKYRPDGPMIGILTLGCILIGIGVFEPESIKFQDWELISKRVNTIEKNLRPFALININTTQDEQVKGGIIYQTFKPDDLEFKTVEVGPDEYNFKLKGAPRFAEVRCEKISVNILRKSKETFGYTTYYFRFSGEYSGGIALCILEAFL